MLPKGKLSRAKLHDTFWALAAIAAAGLALRLFRLGSQSFWYDEAQTLFVARLPLSELLQRVYRPPLYHLLLHGWSALVPDAEPWLRLPSSLFGAALPPLVYLLGSRLYGRKVGLLAALFAAFSPTLLWYSQELRMYSLMALEFALLMILSPWPMAEEREMRLNVLVALFLVEVASLYTHYFAIPFILWLGLASLWTLARQRRWSELKAWLAVQAAAGLAFLPWLMVIRSGRGGAEDYLTAEVNPIMPTTPRVRDFIIQSWQFYTNGPVTPPDARLLPHVSLVAAILLIGVLLALMAQALHHMARKAGQRPSYASTGDAYLLGMTLGPFFTAVLMFKLRPGVVHPRHLMMLAGPLMILMARASSVGFSLAKAAHGRMRAWGKIAQATSLLTGLALISLFVAGLIWYVQQPERQRPNVRALAREVEALTAPGDVVLIPYTDYAFDYYFRGPARVYHLETRVGDEALAEWLLPHIQGARRAVLLRWVHSFADPRDFLPWLLQANGKLQSAGWRAERWLAVYDLNTPFVVPTLSTAEARFGPLRLKGAFFPARAPADQELPIALQWEMSGSTTMALRVSVKALDPLGFIVAQADRVLLSEQAQATTDKWPAGLRARNYYFLKLPPGTPPVTYTLVVNVYSDKGPFDLLSAEGVPIGINQTLGQFQLEPTDRLPASFSSDTSMTRVDAEPAPGLLLEGYSLHPQSVRAGETLNVFLYWRAKAAPLPAYRPEIQIISPSKGVISSQRSDPGYGLYPCSRWRQGEIVIDRRQLTIPPEASSDTADVRLVIEGQGTVLLQRVTIEKSERQFTLPPMQHTLDIQFSNLVRLKGFDVEKEVVKRGDPLRLILYWQAINEAPIPTNYIVFVHLLGPHNQMLAQHDGPPAAGRWPSTAWVKEQVITDVHELAFKDEAYQGEAILEVGLYHPQTLERLKTPEGEDRVILPVRITVLP